jgi:leucyl aminopeptidase
MSLLPDLETAKIILTNDRLVSHSVEQLDVLLVIANVEDAAENFTAFAHQRSWQKLQTRSAVAINSVRSATLPNSRHTLAVLGYASENNSVFDYLTLAGKMLKATEGIFPQHIGLYSTADHPAAVEALLAATLAQGFQLPQFRSTHTDSQKIQKIFLASRKSLDIEHCVAAARGNNLARWLTALPPNKLNPRGYRQLLQQLANQHDLKMRWWDQRALQRAGAGAFLAVTAGSEQPHAGIAQLQYRPRAARGSKPAVALVGKGVTFDTGGINLKPHRGMLDMHIDMAGSAVALASLLALQELRAPFAADAWLAITENDAGPWSYKPQDIVTAANGTTIQVIHTDAEGRMALADTLALASRSQPRLILDFATLTGACIYALSDRMSGIFTNRESLLPQLLAAGQTSGERVWSLPFSADYDTELESKVADIMQCSVENKGDHILAARFLSRFVPGRIDWAHIDLSAAQRSGGLAHINSDITGFGVRYTLNLLLKQRIL